MLVLLALAPLIGVWRIFSTEDWKAQLARAALTVISSFLFLLGLRALPLSTCVMLSFVSPLYMTALAPWVLGERAGIHRWAAVSFGFLGVVIISWPASDGFDSAVLYPLAGALSGALRDLTTRSMTLRSTSESMIFYSVTAMMLAGGVATKGDVSNVVAFDWFLLAVSGITSLIAFYTQVEAFRSAEAATIAPFKYSSLVWSRFSMSCCGGISRPGMCLPERGSSFWPCSTSITASARPWLLSNPPRRMPARRHRSDDRSMISCAQSRRSSPLPSSLHHSAEGLNARTRSEDPVFGFTTPRASGR